MSDEPTMSDDDMDARMLALVRARAMEFPSDPVWRRLVTDLQTPPIDDATWRALYRLENAVMEAQGVLRDLGRRLLRVSAMGDRVAVEATLDEVRAATARLDLLMQQQDALLRSTESNGKENYDNGR